MTIFQMTSVKNNIDYQFKFDTQGRIIGFELMAENTFTDDHTHDLFGRVPLTIVALKQFAQKNKIILTEIKPDLSFDTFWKRYDNTNGSKIRASAIWEKLSEKNKNQAINYISKYKQLLGTTTQAYATTYLNQQYWIK